MRRTAVAVLTCALAWTAGLAAAAPPADVAADPQRRARRDTYHPVTELLKAKAVRLSDEQMEKLKGFPLEAVWASVQQLGYTNAHMSGLHSTRPGEPLVGPRPHHPLPSAAPGPGRGDADPGQGR